MREILFRGQTRRKGEKVRMDGTPVESNWVYGGVLQGTGDHSIIYQTKPDIEKKVVYTDTLGQFTGLTDKNGVRIFEGDIAEYDDRVRISAIGVVTLKNGAWVLTCGKHNYFLYVTRNDTKVIGNIHDDPEMLGGAK